MVDPVFEVSQVGPSTLRLVGEFDLDGVSMFDAAIDQMASNGGVTLDLSELSFIDSSGLKAIATCAQSLNGSGPLTLANPTEFVVKVLEIVCFDKVAGIEVKGRA